MTWFLLGIMIGLCIRCIAKPHKSEEDRFKDPWNWIIWRRRLMEKKLTLKQRWRKALTADNIVDSVWTYF